MELTFVEWTLLLSASVLTAVIAPWFLLKIVGIFAALYLLVMLSNV